MSAHVAFDPARPAHGRCGLTLHGSLVRRRQTAPARSIARDDLFAISAGDQNVTKTTVLSSTRGWTLEVAAAVGIMALAGCNQRESAHKTAEDVSDARKDAQQNVAEERREAADTANETAED